MDWWWVMRLVVPPVLFLLVFSWFVARRRRLAARLQQRWSWLGQARPYQGSGQRWSGEVEGRRIEVRWFEDNTEIELVARPAVAMGFGREGQPPELAHAPGAEPVLVGGKLGYGLDPEAVRQVARQPGVSEALSALLDGPERGLRAVRIEPDRVTWFARQLPEAEITAEEARHWVMALIVVARAAERAYVGGSARGVQ